MVGGGGAAAAGCTRGDRRCVGGRRNGDCCRCHLRLQSDGASIDEAVAVVDHNSRYVCACGRQAFGITR